MSFTDTFSRPPPPIPLIDGLCYLCAPFNGNTEDGWLGRLIVSTTGDTVYYICFEWPAATLATNSTAEIQLFAGSLNCSKAVFRRWAKGGRCLTESETARVTSSGAIRLAMQITGEEASRKLQAAMAGFSDQQLLAEAYRRKLVSYDTLNPAAPPRVRTRRVMLDGPPLAS